jgi:hypothetical protein
MSAVAELVKLASLVALLLCGGAYCYGYLYRPPAARPLHVASLCFTGLALVQLFFCLHVDGGGPLNAHYAQAFLALAALTQGAVLSRGSRRSRAP